MVQVLYRNSYRKVGLLKNGSDQVTWILSADVKNRKIGKGNKHLTKNQKSRNEIDCAEDNRSSMSNICAKEVVVVVVVFHYNDSNFN